MWRHKQTAHKHQTKQMLFAAQIRLRIDTVQLPKTTEISISPSSDWYKILRDVPRRRILFLLRLLLLFFVTLVVVSVYEWF